MDGLHPTCKKCNERQTQKWRKENPQKYKDSNDNHKRNHHKKVIDFTKNWRKENEEHIREYTKIYQQEHPEKLKEYNENRKHKNHIINNREWKSCKEYFNNCCAYCGLPLGKHMVKFKGELIHSDFHKEHFNDDGARDLSNCIPSCKNCNSQKWNFNFNEWYNKDNSIYSQERYDKIMKWINGDYKLYIENKDNLKEK